MQPPLPCRVSSARSASLFGIVIKLSPKRFCSFPSKLNPSPFAASRSLASQTWLARITSVESKRSEIGIKSRNELSYFLCSRVLTAAYLLLFLPPSLSFYLYLPLFSLFVSLLCLTLSFFFSLSVSLSFYISISSLSLFLNLPLLFNIFSLFHFILSFYSSLFLPHSFSLPYLSTPLSFSSIYLSFSFLSFSLAPPLFPFLSALH